MKESCTSITDVRVTGSKHVPCRHIDIDGRCGAAQEIANPLAAFVAPADLNQAAPHFRSIDLERPDIGKNQLKNMSYSVTIVE